MLSQIPVKLDAGRRDGTVVTLVAPVSPLFRAAHDWLKEGEDRAAVLRKLADAYPDQTIERLRQVIVEVAALMHCCGEQTAP